MLDEEMKHTQADVRALKIDVAIVKATTATKEDLAKLSGDIRVEMHKEFAAQTVRIVGWMIAVIGLGVAAMKMLPEVHRDAPVPAQQAQLDR